VANKKLLIKYYHPDELIPYKNNARTHSDKQIKEIEASINEFGFTAPILIGSDHTILAGHGRLMAAKNMGFTEIPTIELSQLSKVQQRAYILADNKLSLNSGWDDNLLKVEIDALKELDFSIDLLGFSVDEITQLNFDGNFEPGTDDDQSALDTIKMRDIECPECNHTFQISKNG